MYHPLDKSLAKALPRWYVIQDAAFASEGFSQTWLPHLWRVKATPMVNAQEYNSITKQAFEPNNIWDPGNYYPAGTVVNNGDKYYTANTNVPPGTDITNTTYWAEKTPDTIAGGTYQGIGEVKTISVNAQWVTSAKQPESVVYQIVKAVYSDAAQKTLAAGHAKGKFITPANAVVGAGIPFHPGAEKFYKEIGLLK